jgi:hypothetical protein
MTIVAQLFQNMYAHTSLHARISNPTFAFRPRPGDTSLNVGGERGDDWQGTVNDPLQDRTRSAHGVPLNVDNILPSPRLLDVRTQSQ